MAADGTGTAERLAEHPNFLYPHTISPDGSRLVMREGVDPSNLVVITLDDERRNEPLVSDEAFSERNAEISPDGRWMAYESNESGRFEIYVRPFPDVNTGRSQVSATGGREPVWSRSGEELFYRNPDGALMGVPVVLGETFSAGNASVVVPQSTYMGTGVMFGRTCDVSPDGQRFLVVRDGTDSGSTGSVVVVRNWFEELARLVPTP